MKHPEIAILTASLLLLPGLGIPVCAEETDSAAESAVSETSEEAERFTSEDGVYQYTLTDDGTASIYMYLGSDAEIVIPGELDGYTVTELDGGAFTQQTQLTTVTIPASLETIGDSCFFGCTALEEIQIEEGNDAFVLRDGVLFSADGEDLILYPTASAETSYAVPDGVREIWASAFAQTALTEVALPDGLLYIDSWAFSGTPLESLEMPDSVKEIGQYAFSYCTNLTAVDFPESLEVIEAAAFAGDSNLTSVTFQENLAEIQMAAFAGTGMKEVTIPDSVTYIGFCAFGYEEDMETTVEGFVVYGSVGSVAQSYCTSEDSENNYSNSFTFRSVMSEEVSGDETAVTVESQEEGFWQQYGKWILLGAAVVVLLAAGVILLLSGRKKQDPAQKKEKGKEKEKQSDQTAESASEASPEPEASEDTEQAETEDAPEEGTP